MSNVKFTWPSGPNDVIVTGNFDNWSQSLPLLKQTDGSFEIIYPIDLSNKEKEDKIQFKFVVDGDWKTSESYEIETDDSNNSNNIIYYKDLISIKDNNEGEKKEVIIPESAGLPIPIKELSKPKEFEKEFKPTVMPSNENQQITLGEPGIVIPENANEIEAFKHVSTLDPKVLNEPETEIIASAPENTTPEEIVAAAKEATNDGGDAAPTDIVAEEITSPATITAPTTATSEAISETSSKKTKKVKKIITKVKKSDIENGNYNNK
ncbi:unnamed protein product [[Candida] boidinii]|uniref:Unnamed protein product n=1 Tax=Candida boidinii TaxID=5477 RepID=A0ACB5TP94_CANBO|nr:unnamed protein product [[Candida] boidinii]